MNYEPKKCHFCHSSDIRKHGIRNNIQRYKCNACNKTFTLKKKLNPPLSRDLNIIADT
ncbi:transposase, partial [Glaesserella parasuis]